MEIDERLDCGKADDKPHTLHAVQEIAAVEGKGGEAGRTRWPSGRAFQTMPTPMFGYKPLVMKEE